MAEENIDININTVVSAENFEQLKDDLIELETKEWSVAVNSEGLDEFGNKVDDAGGKVDDLKDNLDDIDGGGAKEAANDVSQVGTESSTATESVSDLTNVLNLIGGALATGGIIAGLDAIAGSADSVNQQLNAMSINFNLDPAGMSAASAAINQLNADTGIAKGSIRNFVNGLGLMEVTSVEAATGVMRAAAQISYLKTGSNDAAEGIAQLFSRSISSGKLMERTFASNGISLENMAARAGMTKDEMIELFATMSTDERAAFLSQYAVDVEDAKAANEGLKDSYDSLRDKFDQKIGALGTAFGQMVLPILLPAIGLLVDAFQFLADVVNGLPDWAKIALGVGILTAAFALIGIVLMTSVIPAATAAIIGFLNMIPGMLGVAGAAVPTTMGMAGVSAAFWSAAAAVWAFISPLLPFIAIGLAVAGVIYLIGQYFGWWKDIPTMIQAIQAGVMRLWDAFVNNEHVQAIIEWLKAAWQGVLDFLQPLFAFITDMWNNIFPPQEGGFDVVQQIINLFGWLGDGIALVVGYVQANWPIVSTVLGIVLIPLRLIISVIQLIYSNWGRITSWFQVGANTIKGAINALLAPFVSFASGVMNAYNTYIAPVINWIADGINKLKEFLGLQSQAAGGAAAGGYSLSAAGGLLTERSEIVYPEKKEYHIYLNGLVTEQSMIDYLLELIQKGDDQEAMRS
jgi:hypothetical protein